jgi:hypothetical protein
LTSARSDGPKSPSDFRSLPDAHSEASTSGSGSSPPVPILDAWSNGTTPPLHGGNRGSTPRVSIWQSPDCGPLAQLAERSLCKREAPGSTSVGLGPTTSRSLCSRDSRGCPLAAVAEWSNAPACKAGSRRSGNPRFQSRPDTRNVVSMSGRGSNPTRGFCRAR